ncbi:MAG TPA: PAAR domain-containing protein [Telluria sp.]|jgi:uncharacterized Zn-binding protein involved in type VI secretion
MLKAVILEGDTTSHGGKVLEGRNCMTLDGRRIAQQGHKTFCPKCKGVFPIAEGVPFHSLGGVGTAVEGMRTECGALLIASQSRMRIEYPRGPAEPFTASPPAGTDTHINDEAIRAIDEVTGLPVAGLRYRLELSDGTCVRGTTDEQGMTQRVATGSDIEVLKLFWEQDISDPEA